MRKSLYTIVMLLSAGLGASLAAPAQAAGVAGLFGQGRVNGSIMVGSGSAFNYNYTIIGAGVNYYVIDGLSLGLAYESWSGPGPHISKITPSVQYVFYQLGRVKPYVGAFYRRTQVTGQPDFNSAGARAGAYISASRHAAFGLGIVEERFLSCQRTLNNSCSQSYVEASMLFGF
ncbi:MAG TPA: hypothetical protein VKC56_07475 [Gallionellaceae bacterium]|nr:hypothetical protein [Gallionellaceae bacterium]